MTYNASNTKDIRRAEKASRQAELDRVNFLVGAMSIPQGRAWVYTLLDECHLFASEFIADPYLKYWRDGERNVGLRLFADISRHCPDSYILMIKEANDRRIIADIAANRDHDPASAGERPGSEDTGRDAVGRDADLFDYDPGEGPGH